MNVKFCKHCGLVKSASSFAPQKDRPCGLSGWCKECRNLETKRKRDAAPKKPKQPRKRTVNGRLCSVCGTELVGRQKNVCSDNECGLEYKRRKSYQYDSAKKVIKTRKCKECGEQFTSEYGNKRRYFCSDECGDRHNGRVAKSVRRVRMRGDDGRMIESIDPFFILERDGWRCYLCGVKTPKRLRGTCEPNAPEVDHVVPVARGGSHTEDNLRCCCRRCNQAKSDRALGDMQLTVSVQLRLV